MKRGALAVAWGYMGAVIGAGFASGQELVQFFVGYGSSGGRGVLLAGLLFALFGGLLLFWVNVHQLDNYQSVLKSLFGKRFSLIVDTLLAIFLFLGLCIMFSASGAVFYEHVNRSKTTGILLAYFGVLFFLFTGRAGLVRSYNLLVPIKFLLLLTVAGYAAVWGGGVNPPAGTAGPVVNPNVGNWIVASVLYVAYNFTLAMVVLVEYRPIISFKDGVKGACLGGLMLGAIALVCYYALLPSMPMIIRYEIPMLYVAGTISVSGKVVYMVVLWIGILTTAIANTYGFAQRASDFSGLGYNGCLFITVTLALPLAFQSFRFLVATVYPLLGLLGIVILVALIRKLVGYSLKALSYSLEGIMVRLFRGG